MATHLRLIGTDLQQPNLGAGVVEDQQLLRRDSHTSGSRQQRDLELQVGWLCRILQLKGKAREQRLRLVCAHPAQGQALASVGQCCCRQTAQSFPSGGWISLSEAARGLKQREVLAIEDLPGIESSRIQIQGRSSPVEVEL